MIRKDGKARWTYTCEPCSVHATSPDQFRAIEAQQRHEKGLGHFGAVIGRAADELAKVYIETLRPIGDLMESISATFAPPPNLPHDPSMLRDRRKWGGR